MKDRTMDSVQNCDRYIYIIGPMFTNSENSYILQTNQHAFLSSTIRISVALIVFHV
jgi:hypothetical protein